MIKDRETRLKYYRDYQKARRTSGRKDGLCIICSKREISPGYKTCEICRTRNRILMREKRALI